MLRYLICLVLLSCSGTVCPTKYRRAVITDEVEAVLRRVCIDISNRYEIMFLEIGVDSDHVHFLVQSVPTYTPKKIVQTIKSITAREVFARVPSVKRELWGGAFWSSGYYIDTVGRHGSEEAIRNYVADQGRQQEYRQLYSAPFEPPAYQLSYFSGRALCRNLSDTPQLAAGEISLVVQYDVVIKYDKAILV